MELPKNAIGRIGGGKRKPSGLIDVAVIQSLVRKGVVDEIVSKYGHVIVDECHHLPAFSFEQITRQIKAKFITGLSATVTRKDGHHPIILMRCGPIRYRVDAKAAAAMRPFEHTVLVCPTSFTPSKPANEDTRLRFHELYEEIVQDEVHNQLICTDVINAVQRGRSPIILTERTDHLDRLFNKLSPHIRHLIVLRGGMSSKEIVAATNQIANIPTNEPRVLLATGKLWAKVLMMLGLTHFFLPCLYLGRVPLPNMLVGFIVSMQANKKYKFTIMQILEFLCSKGCSIEDVKVMKQ